MQRCFGGVRYLNGIGPSVRNISKLDSNARPMIQLMQNTGMSVDLTHFANMEKTLEQDLDSITAEVHRITGHHINLASSEQKSILLFKTLGLKQARPVMTTGGDRESVENEVLVAIQHDHEVVGLMLQYAELDKLRGTYVAPIPKLAKHTKFGEWKIYPRFKTTRIPSGRFACSSPNLLAMPSRTDRGREVKKGFPARPGYVYVSVDESQIEVRVAAHRSQDKALMRIYENEEDIYYDFATTAFKKKDQRYRDETGWHYPGIDKITERFPAKTCVLASIYDVTAGGLLEQMPVVCGNCNWISLPLSDKNYSKHSCSRFISLWTEQKCQELITAFYLRYPGLMTMRKADHRRAMAKTMLWDDWGRILHTTAVRSVHPWVVSAALREAANMPVQGTACGTLKLTMAALYPEWIQDKGLQEICSFLLPVHDELVVECREDTAQDVGEWIKYHFENCVKLSVPIKAEYSDPAPSWGLISK